MIDQAPILAGGGGFDDDPPPEPREGWLLVRVHVPELNVFKCLQFPSERLVWDVKQQVLASLPKELKESFNYGLFCPPSNGKAGKFLDEERRLGDYPFNGPVGYLELKYKRRVYKMLNLDEKQLKALHTRANLRRFLECINGGHVEKIAKMCAKGLDPNFHCTESGNTPLTLATGTKKPNKLLIALVNGGALLDYRTKDGATALHKAVENDCLEAVSTLLELGASPNYRDARGLTPLYLSVIKKTDAKICESLLHDHATLSITDAQGWMEIHQACRHGLVHHLEHLLFYGADMDGRNASGNTSLHVCAVNNQEACARMLLFRGADRAALNYANQTPYQVAVIAGNLELAEMIQNYKPEDIVPFRGPPRYNPRRRSGIGWTTTTIYPQPPNIYASSQYSQHHIDSIPPSPCPSEHPFSSASSSLSEGSTSNRSHEDDISIVTDKSIGDTSDIISDSSGVGTNSDSAACSIGHPSTTVVCIESYTSSTIGHISIQAGDVIEVVGSTDCGLLEGYVRGTNRSGFFPAEIVQEVNIRQKNITNVSTANVIELQQQQQQIQHQQQQLNQQPTQITNETFNRDSMDQSQSDEIIKNCQPYSSATAPRQKKIGILEPRSVILHRAKRGFGFVLRGAKAASPLMQLKPSDRCPGLQYLDDVDPGGVADMAGLFPGDFLLAINGEDVRCASHEHVVDLIRSSGSLVTMTVISQMYPNNFQQQQQQQQFASTINARQCATLPRKMTLGSKLPAPMPPRRDPKTTLSVGRARAKSMVAGLEGGSGSIEKEDDDDLPGTTKSSSVESIHQQSLSSSSTPIQSGTPVQLRTASIKARPTSSRITAAELVELFQRQTGEPGENRYSTMMCSSRFQSGTDTPPSSPQKGPIVYASVAEMKRKKNKMGTMRGKPCSTPSISDLKRTFHSTPDLASGLSQSNQSIFTNINGFKGHRSQDDMYSMQSASMHSLPPPTCAPPPIPVGQLVKVDVSRGSDYESTVQLQKQLAARIAKSAPEEGPEIRSSFKPATNAKLYACPQSLRSVAYRSTDNATAKNEPNTKTSTLVRKTASLRTPANQVTSTISYAATGQKTSNQYAQPIRAGTLPHPMHQRASLPQLSMPQIPDPDYSLSESDGEDENSILLAHNTKMNEHIAVPIETSGNSNASGSSSGSGGSISHSFSVDEIQKMRIKLKSSKSFPNGLLAEQLNEADETKHQQQSTQKQKSMADNHKADQSTKLLSAQKNNKLIVNHDECDNSSSGVSSDQEISNTKTPPPPPTTMQSTKTVTNSIMHSKQGGNCMANATTTIIGGSNDNNNVKEMKPHAGILKTSMHNSSMPNKLSSNNATTSTSMANVKIVESMNKKSINLPPLSNITKQISAAIIDDTKNANDDFDDSFDDLASPPSKGFQRHNSLTRKQAATIAQNRALYTKSAVSLVQLPPPIEADNDEHDQNNYHAAECRKNTRNLIAMKSNNAKMIIPSAALCIEPPLPSMVVGVDDNVLAPPPEFSDTVSNIKASGTTNSNAQTRSVRIVGAVPKRLQSH